jgi:hypothetical protein
MRCIYHRALCCATFAQVAPRRKPDDQQRRSKAVACLTVGEHEELRATMGRERLSVRDVLLMGLEALRARGRLVSTDIRDRDPVLNFASRYPEHSAPVPFTERLR